MATLNTGLVIVGAYADKVRRTLFAQLKDRIKAKEIDSKIVAKASGDLNKLLYEIFVNRLKLDKGDVVRIVVNYDVVDGEIVWYLEWSLPNTACAYHQFYLLNIYPMKVF